MDKRIITDRPEQLGYVDGLKTGYGDRTYQGGSLPQEQQTDYKTGFQRGYRHGKQDSASLDED